MKTISIGSFAELKKASSEMKRAYLLLYRAGSEASDCALKSLKEVPDIERIEVIFTADVSSVLDIHPEFGIDSVPGLLEIDDGKLITVYKGCNSVSFYQSVFSGGHSLPRADGAPVKRVTVYSTPTCSWCNTLKTYLRDNHINFRDIDVSTDQKAAAEMVRRSGQQGVPQTDINGTMIVGFDRAKIDSLLDIGK